MSHPIEIPPKIEIAFGYKAFDAVPDDGWVDITDYVDLRSNSTSLTATSGRRAGGTTRTQLTPGRVSLALENHDGRFDPRNADGPYYGDLVNGVPIRITTGTTGDLLYGDNHVYGTGLVYGSGTGYGCWRGWINSGWPQQYTQRLRVVTVTAHDLFGLLAQGDPPASALAAEITAAGVDPDHWWTPGADGWIDSAGALTGRHTGSLRSVDPTVNGLSESFGQGDTDGVGVIDHPDARLSAGTDNLLVAMRFRLATEATRAALTDPDEETPADVVLVWQTEADDDTPFGVTVERTKLTIEAHDSAGYRTAETATVRLMDGYAHSLLIHAPAGTGDLQVWVDGRPIRTTTSSTVAAATLTPGALMIGGRDTSIAPLFPYQGAIDPVIVWRDHPATGLDDLARTLHTAATAGWAGQRLDQRVSKIVAGVGAASMVGELDVSGVVTQQAYRQRPMLELLAAIEDTEQGRIWIDRNGRLRFSQRGWSWTDTVSTTVQATFSDVPAQLDAGAIEFLPDTVLNDDPLDLVNVARVNSTFGRQQTAVDRASREQYGERSAQLSNLLHPSDRQSKALAEWLIFSQATAPVRLERVSFTVESDPVVAGALAQRVTEGWLVRLIKAPLVDEDGNEIGDPIDVEGHVVGVEHSWPFGQWVVTLTVACTRTGVDWFCADTTPTDDPAYVAAF